MFNIIKGKWSIWITCFIFIYILGIMPTTGYTSGFFEDFSTDPFINGWIYSGSTDTLFSWNSVNQYLECRWYPATTLSHFSKNPGFIIDNNRSFRLEFDLFLTNISNVQPFANNPLAIGFYNSGNSGNRVRNIIEFNYYPGTNTAFGGPNWLGISSINTGSWYDNWNNLRFSFEAYTLATSVLYNIQIQYDHQREILILNMTADSSPFVIFDSINMSGFNFNMDQFAITNWFDGFDSFLIEGWIDNIEVRELLPTYVTDWDKYKY